MGKCDVALARNMLQEGLPFRMKNGLENLLKTRMM